MQRPGTNTLILIGAIAGVLIGAALATLPQDAPVKAGVLYTSTLAGSIFIGLLKMVLIPLVFTSIVVGIANLQQHQQAQRVWQSTLGFFALSTTLAILLGLTASHVFRPGAGLHLGMFSDSMQHFEANKLSLPDFFLQLVQGLFVNPFTALSQTNVLAVVVFALFVGIALVVGGERYRNILQLMREFLELTMRMIGWIMWLAPIGIMALLIKLVATQDTALLGTMSEFIAVIVGTTLFHGVVVLPLLLYIVTRVTPLAFWRGSKDALITAFATSSSSATLPVTMRCTEVNFKVRRDIAGFVVPLGATLNMDGTALYEAAAALFIANLAGIDLSLGQQLIVFITAMIAAVGAPGIPSAGMVTMVMVLQSVGLPAEAIAILLPIDRLLDTIRTSVNVQGDMIGSLIVQRLVDGKTPARAAPAEAEHVH